MTFFLEILTKLTDTFFCSPGYYRSTGIFGMCYFHLQHFLAATFSTRNNICL